MASRRPVPAGRSSTLVPPYTAFRNSSPKCPVCAFRPRLRWRRARADQPLLAVVAAGTEFPGREKPRHTRPERRADAVPADLTGLSRLLVLSVPTRTHPFGHTMSPAIANSRVATPERWRGGTRIASTSHTPIPADGSTCFPARKQTAGEASPSRASSFAGRTGRRGRVEGLLRPWYSGGEIAAASRVDSGPRLPERKSA